MRKPKSNGVLDRYLKGDSALTKIYQSAKKDEPTSRVDQIILAASRKPESGGELYSEMRSRHARPAYRATTWYVPLSAAAVVVLTVGLFFFMSEKGAVPLSDRPTFVERDKKPDQTVKAPASAPVPALGQAPTLKAEPAPPPQEEAESAPAPRTAVPLKKPAAAASAQKKTDPAKTAPVGQARTRSIVLPPPEEMAAATAASVAPEEARKMKQEEKAMKSGTPASVADTHVAALPATGFADVVSVKVSGVSGAYQFAVTVRSPDTGCSRYANWWEVVSEDGRLLYRRVLAHSHVDEQPFVRAGGPVTVAASTVVIVRSHLHPSGYGGIVMKGSAATGFKPEALSADFAKDLAKKQPLPDACDF
jgi:hypothetical protein